ncbi:hypothetical protein [Paenibacillus turpanensis]|nr:hypothetical protein [Paenibacillus turpanensis]
MANKGSQDSKLQQIQEKENRKFSNGNDEPIIDKKLDGPNRPST